MPDLSFGDHPLRQFRVLLLAGTLLGGVLYLHVLQPAWRQYDRYRLLKSQLLHAETMERDYAQYRDNLPGATGLLQQQCDVHCLFETVTKACGQHRLLIRSLSEPRMYRLEELEVVYQELEVEGGFADMIRLAREVERAVYPGRICHLYFFLQKDREKKKQVLRCRVSVQLPVLQG